MKCRVFKADRGAHLEALGMAIRAIRKEKGISQEELADFAGIDRSHVGRIERGERNVSIQNVIKIAGALDCSAWEMLKKAGL